MDDTSLEMLCWCLGELNFSWLTSSTNHYYIKYYEVYLVLKDIDLSLMVFFFGNIDWFALMFPIECIGHIDFFELTLVPMDVIWIQIIEN